MCPQDPGGARSHLWDSSLVRILVSFLSIAGGSFLGYALRYADTVLYIVGRLSGVG